MNIIDNNDCNTDHDDRGNLDNKLFSFTDNSNDMDKCIEQCTTLEIIKVINP